MYRKNVCAILFNEEGQVLGCRRVNEIEQYQFVQGGVEDSDRDIVAAALREIEEEIGLTPQEVTFVQEVLPPSGNPEEFRYVLRPHAGLRRKGFVGQQQRVLLFFAPTRVMDRIRLVPPPQLQGAEQEFDKVEWMTFSVFLDNGHWEKQLLYYKFARIVPALISAYLKERKENDRANGRVVVNAYENSPWEYRGDRIYTALMYRNNVCAILFNEDGQILGCRRRKSPHYQCVQGGVEKCDTDIIAAALREVEEEVGLTAKDVTFVHEILPPSGNPEEFRYELAPTANLRRFGYIGQQQRMILFFTPRVSIEKVVLVPPPELKALQEFERVDWITFEELMKVGHPSKLHLFEMLSRLAPPIMEKFLASQQQHQQSV